LPEGAIPVFLSGKTQQIYNVVCDEDVTKENPLKIITKEAILEDLHNRAAVCDFHPLKQKIIVRVSFFFYALARNWNMLLSTFQLVTKPRCRPAHVLL